MHDQSIFKRRKNAKWSAVPLLLMILRVLMLNLDEKLDILICSHALWRHLPPNEQ